MKILAIGNSFSEDCTALIEDIAASAGIPEVIAANLYIGGCPLSHHAENLKTDQDEYAYQRRGKALFQTSIHTALKSESWNVVTLQQVSGLSGKYDTFHPYIDEVYREVKRYCPKATVYLNRTWAYEEGSSHPCFSNYDCDRKTMDEAIEAVYKRISAEFSAEILPVGNVITGLKQLPDFNPVCGGISLYRDAFHLSLTYGRFAAACTWLRKLCMPNLDRVSFLPEGADSQLIAQIIRYIESFYKSDSGEL